MFIGILFFGAGVFPEALVALAFRGEWGRIGAMLLHLVAILGMRWMGLAIGSAYERRKSLAAMAADSAL
jgi:hypothetical protein